MLLRLTFVIKLKFGLCLFLYSNSNFQVNQYRQFNISHEGKDFSADSGGNYCITEGERGRCAAEDIADNIGLRLAYNALQHFRGKEKEICLPDLPFSANQLFWVKQYISEQKKSIPNFSLHLQWTGVPLKTSQHTKSCLNRLW